MAYSFMDNFKSILPGGKPTNKNALSNMGQSFGDSVNSAYNFVAGNNSEFKDGLGKQVQTPAEKAYRSRQAAKKAAQILSTYSNSSIAKNPNSIFMQQAQAGNRNPNTTMQVTPTTLNKVIKTDAQILAEQNARIAANQPKVSEAPLFDPSRTGSAFNPTAPRSTATGVSGGGFSSVAPKKTTPAAPMATTIRPYDYAAANAAASNRVVAQPQAGTLTVKDAFAGIPQVQSDNMRYAEINALSLQKQYEDDLNAQITAQNLYTSGQNEYANRQNIYQTNLAAEKDASDESTALKNYIEDQRIANVTAQVAARRATQPDFIDNRNMSEYGTSTLRTPAPSQPLVVPYTNQLNQSSLMAGLQNNVAPQQQVIENIFASGLPTGAIPTLESTQQANIAAEAARVAALEASRLPTLNVGVDSAPVQSSADALVAELAAAQQAAANRVSAQSTAAQQAAANQAAQSKMLADFNRQIADIQAQKAAGASSLSALNRTNVVGLREALSRGMMLSQGRAADVYGGRAPALLGQMVTGQQRAFTKGLGAENASYLDQYANLNKSYIDAVNAANIAQAEKVAARAKQIADAASIRSTLGMGA